MSSSLYDFELICVNDGSTDNTGKLLLEYEEKDQRIIVINQENLGVSSARNTGLEASQGKYIAFVDSDDVVDENCFLSTVECAEHNKADLVICGYSEIDSSGAIRKQVHPQQEIIFGREFFNSRVPTWARGFVWGRIYRRGLIDGSRFTDTINVMEDNLFNIQIFSLNPNSTIAFIDDNLYHRLNRDGSLSTSLDAASWDDCAAIFINSLLCLSDKYPFQKKQLLIEAFKKGLRLRWHVQYGSSLRRNRADEVLNRVYKKLMLEGKLSAKEYVEYSILFFIPHVYHAYLIHRDQSILEADRRRRRNKVIKD